jgi:hypothetical protein
MKAEHNWARLLAYITGLVNLELLLQNEFLVAENRILRAHLPARLRLSNPERATLAEIGKRVGRKALAQVACVAKPDTILGWYRRPVAAKFDGSRYRSYPGRPRISPEMETLIVRFARENPSWGYDRIAGALITSDTTSRTRRLGMFFGGMGSHRHPNEARRPPGKNSFGLRWPCWRESISSLSKC